MYLCKNSEAWISRDNEKSFKYADLVGREDFYVLLENKLGSIEEVRLGQIKNQKTWNGQVQYTGIPRFPRFRFPQFSIYRGLSFYPKFLPFSNTK